jgi:hypothetical protein
MEQHDSLSRYLFGGSIGLRDCKVVSQTISNKVLVLQWSRILWLHNEMNSGNSSSLICPH